jgi:hypothetical protein
VTIGVKKLKRGYAENAELEDTQKNLVYKIIPKNHGSDKERVETVIK